MTVPLRALRLEKRSLGRLLAAADASRAPSVPCTLASRSRALLPSPLALLAPALVGSDAAADAAAVGSDAAAADP